MTPSTNETEADAGRVQHSAKLVQLLGLTATARLNQDPRAESSQFEQDFVDPSLSGVWPSAREKYGRDPASWHARTQETVQQAVRQRRMADDEILGYFLASDRAERLPFPALSRVDGGTIGCQTAQSKAQ